MKQTAVEWLVSNMPNIGEYIPLGVTLEFQAKIEQAKAIDEKNIKDSFVAGAGVGEMFNNENRCYVTDAEQYYNETFK